MKVAQNDETNPDTQPVHSPRVPSIVNLQHFTSVHLTENTEPREYFPDASPLHRYRLLPRRTRLALPVILLCTCLLCIYCFSPLFSPVDYETDAAVDQFDYGVDDSSLLPEQPGKPPPLITRYRLFSSILLALE